MQRSSIQGNDPADGDGLDDRVLVLRSTASEAVTRGKYWVRVGPAHVQGLAASLVEAAADLVVQPTTGGEYHG